MSSALHSDPEGDAAMSHAIVVADSPAARPPALGLSDAGHLLAAAFLAGRTAATLDAYRRAPANYVAL